MSPQYSLTKHDGMRILQAFGSSLAAYIITFLLQLIPNVNFGQYSVLVMIALVPLLHAAQRFFEGSPADTTVTPPSPSTL